MITYTTLKNWVIPDVEHSYSADDCMRYALAIGMGADPVDAQQLKFVNDTGEGMPLAMPTMAVVLGYPGSWMRDPATGIDFSLIVHGEESVTWHAPLAASGTVVARHRVTHVVDKGQGRGAVITYDKELTDKASGRRLATVTHTTVARGNGGFSSLDGLADVSPPRRQPVATSAPDKVVELPTLPQLALLYRLCADRNPLHSDPASARAAGFERPILHGLCTSGVVSRAILDCWCDFEPNRLKSLSARFTAPVFPGETIGVEMHAVEGGVDFRAIARERGKVVLDGGHAAIA
jgi:acyl dehydratase